MFAPQVDEFSSDYRVITWDWRGFGQTVTDGKPFTIWDQVDDLLALLDHLGVDQAVFGGMSHVGYITMHTPLAAPDRVRGIITMDTNALGLSPEEQAAYRHMFETWMDQGPTDELCDTFGDIIIGDPTLNAEWKAIWQSRPKDAMRQAVEVTITLEPIAARLPEIGCPAVVIHGKDDKAFSVAQAEAIAGGLRHADGVVLVPGGHAANMSHPTEVNQAIRTFLSRL